MFRRFRSGRFKLSLKLRQRFLIRRAGLLRRRQRGLQLRHLGRIAPPGSGAGLLGGDQSLLRLLQFAGELTVLRGQCVLRRGELRL